MTRRVAAHCTFLLLASLPASAQQAGTSSSWGVVGTFVPTWEVTSTFEPLAALHFSEDEVPIDQQNLTGGEFRIGVARGRALGGDWGVSYVRRTFEDFTYRGVSGGNGCSGGGGASGVVLQCDSGELELTRSDAVLNGVEVHKFISFFTIAQRVQVGLNLAGGYGAMSGQVDVKEFQTRFTCVYPPGVLPSFSGDANTPESICTGATITNRTSVQTGASTDDISRLMKSSNNMPIGRVELAAAFIVAPQFKLRVGGGFNYPGTNVFAITGVFFFKGN